MSEVIDKLIETYPVYKDVDRSALIDAVGKKYPVYLEHKDFKDEFDALQTLNKSAQEEPAPVTPEPSVPAKEAFDELFAKPAASAPASIPETTSSPLVQSALEKTGADVSKTPLELFKGAATQDIQTLKDIQDKPLIELPKPTVNPDDPSHVKFMKGLGSSLVSGVEGLMTMRSGELVAAGALMGPVAPYFFGTLGLAGAGRAGYQFTHATTPEDKGAALGDTILNLGMAELARRSGKAAPPAKPLAPMATEAAAAVIKEGGQDASSIGKTEAIHGDVLNEQGAREGAQQMSADEGSKGIPAQEQGPALLGNEGLATKPPAELFEQGPGIEGMGAASPSEFPEAPSPVKEAMESAVSPLQKARRTIARMWETGEVKDAMAYTQNAGDNQAALFGKQMANDIRQPFKGKFGKDATKAEEALSFAREAGMNEDELRSDRERVATSKEASSKWGRKALDALDYALYHLDDLKLADQRYGEITDAQQNAEEARGIPTLRRERYVPHVQDIEQGDTFLSSASGGDAKPFTKVRTFDKLSESIAAGIDPKTINAVDLLEHRLRQGQRLINNRAWTESLKSLVDPTTKRPVGTDPRIVKRADGTTYPEAPEGYKLELLGNQMIAVQNGYEGIFSALTNPSFFRQSLAGRGFLEATGAGKSISLMIDTFHLGRVAFWESLIKSLGITTFEAPFPSYKKGLTILDFTQAQIREMADRGEIPKKWTETLIEDKRNLSGLVEHGYNLGRISDSLFQGVIHNIPFAGKFNKFIFEQFQRGAMNEIGLLETQRLRNARPELSDRDVWRQVAMDLNTRFGNLGSQGIFKSRSGQDLARMLVLAPQWNEGLIRSELGAVTQTVKAGIDVAQGKRIYGGVLMRSVGAMALAQFAANQLINLYTRGYPTWDNPEEGFGAKVSAWIPDKIGKGPGFFLHPLGLAAETTHLILGKYEKTADFAKTLNQYLRSRVSTSMRPLMTFVTNQDFLGRSLKPGTVWGEIAKSAIPSPIGGSAITAAGKQLATGQPSEAFPGQFQKQLMSSVGVKTDQAPSPEQRISGLAKEFNAKRGVTPSAEFYAGDYQALTSALRIGNTYDASKAIDELLKKKTVTQIMQHYRTWQNHPFTSHKTEAQFKASLTPEQMTQYGAAIAERKRIGMLGQQLAREAAARPKVRNEFSIRP